MLLFAFGQISAASEWEQSEVEAMARRAETTVLRAFEVLWEYRLDNDMVDTIHDPNKTGTIGVEYSYLTTTMGYVESKQLSTLPGWASWLVHGLTKRGFFKGAKVAVSMSGSFPALNIALLAALQELDAKVQAVSSIGASSWGANEIGLSWPEMERLLIEEGVLKIGSSAVTLGGTGDRGAEWGEYSLNLALKAVKRSRLPLLKPMNLKDAIRKRMQFYDYPEKYVCFINVGGGQTSIGGGAKPRFTSGGWYYDPIALKGNPPGVMDSFLKAGAPCLHLLNLEELNRRYNIVRPNIR